MRLLLGTHKFHAASPERLPSKVLEAFCDAGNQLFLSLASVWEMQIKAVNGKLKLRFPLREMIEVQCENWAAAGAVDTSLSF